MSYDLPSSDAPVGPVPRRVPEGTVPLVAVEGTAYECGRWYGETVCREYPDYIKSLPPSRWWKDISGDAKRLYERHIPHIFDIFRGLAEGVGATATASLAHEPRPAGCTSFSVSGAVTLDSRPISGQTKDPSIDRVPLYIVLRMRIKDAPSTLGLSYPGGLSGHGMWSTGVSIMGNSLYSTGDADGRLSMGEWCNLALAGTSVHEAVELARRFGITGRGNYLVTDGQGESRSIEFNVGGVSVLHPREGILTHGNHPEGPETSPFGAYDEDGEGATERENSRYRMHGLWGLLNAERGRLTPQKAMMLLGDHTYYPQGICRHWVEGRPDMETTAAIVVEPAQGRLHAVRGQPCANWPTTYTI